MLHRLRSWSSRRSARAAGSDSSAPAAPDDPLRATVKDFLERGLTDDDRARARDEAEAEQPPTPATSPAGGELDLHRTACDALGALRQTAASLHDELDKRYHGRLGAADRAEKAAETERSRAASLSPVGRACLRIGQCSRAAKRTAQELQRFRKDHGLSDTEEPRAKSPRWWAWLLVIFLLESALNGALIYQGSTTGLLLAVLQAGFVGAINVGLLGWLLGSLVGRRWRFAGFGGRAAAVGLTLLIALPVATVLHLGFAHYRDAIRAVAASHDRASETIFGLDDFEESDGVHAPIPLPIGEAVLNELRAQLYLWPPTWEFAVHLAEDPADHSQDRILPVAPGELGYRAENGQLFRTEDAEAGRLNDFWSLILFWVGVLALLLAVVKWYYSDAPEPWGRLHRAAEEAGEHVEAGLRTALGEQASEAQQHHQALSETELEVKEALRSLDPLHQKRLAVRAREAEVRREVVSAAVDRIEGYRAENRDYRSDTNDPPAFWRTRWTPPPALLDTSDPTSRWECELRRDVETLREAHRRLCEANREHRPVADAKFAERRERIRRAAHRSGMLDREDVPRKPEPPTPDPVSAAGEIGNGPLGPSGEPPIPGLRPSASHLAALGLAFLLVGPAACGASAAGECPEWPDDPGLAANRYVVVVDATEGVSAIQRRNLRNSVVELADASPRKSVFHIYQIHERWEEGFRRLRRVCRPPRWDEVNPITDNPDLRRRQWNPRYLRPLAQAVDRAARGEPSSESAILQAVSGAASSVFRSPVARPGDRRILTLVSDLMQHACVSFYDEIPALEDFRRTDCYRWVRTESLRGAEATILRLPLRDWTEGQEETLTSFWTEYLQDQGIAALEVRDVMGPPIWAETP